MAQDEYKRRHGNVARKAHWDLSKRNGLEQTKKWFEHVPEGAVENEEVNVLREISAQCDNVIEAIRPDIIVINKKELKGIIIKTAVPADVRVREKEKEKVKKYKDLKIEIVEPQNGRSRACSDRNP